MKSETTSFKINMPNDLMAKMRDAAEKECRSMTGQIIRVLRAHFDTDATTQK